MRRPSPFARFLIVAVLLLVPRAFCAADGVHVAIQPLPAVVEPGDTIVVEVAISTADEEFNAFDLNLGFDPARLTFVPTTPVSNQRGELITNACANTFHVFNAQATQLAATLSILCNNVFVTGPGVIYRVKFLANAGSGVTILTCNPGTQFYRAGFTIGPLDCVDGSVMINDTSATDVGEAGGLDPLVFSIGALAPNPYAGHGSASVDLRLPRAGDVVLELFDASGRRVAHGGAAFTVAAGRQRVVWEPGALASGVYHLRAVSASDGAATARWVVLR